MPSRSRFRPGTSFAALLASLCILVFATDLRAQQVTVQRDRLARRLPAGLPASVATVTATGVDSLAFGRSLVVDRSRFLAFRTGDLVTSDTGRREGPVIPARPPGSDTVAGVSAAPSESPPVTGGEQPGRETLVLPFRFMTADGRGEDLWVLRPVFQVASPLRLDAASGLFRGAFYLAVEDSANRGTSRPLDVPIRLRVAADADSLVPVELSFESTNFPLHEVAIASASARDSVSVRIIPEFDLRGVEVWLPVRPQVVIETRPRSVQGLGIESIPITVSVRGARLREPVTVRFETDRGTLEPEQVTLGEDGTGVVRIRSAGIGSARVRAFAPGLGEHETTYAFGWPVAFLLAALLGGIAGGLGAAVSKQRVTRTGLRRALTRGLVYGLIAAVVYYAIGVSLLNIDIGVARFNEAAVFALAALAGLLGLRLPELVPAARS